MSYKITESQVPGTYIIQHENGHPFGIIHVNNIDKVLSDFTKLRTCQNCRHWRTKSDSTGICDNPEWAVDSAMSVEMVGRLIDGIPNTNETQIQNLAAQITGIRTKANFGCNQFEK